MPIVSRMNLLRTRVRPVAGALNPTSVEFHFVAGDWNCNKCRTFPFHTQGHPDIDNDYGNHTHVVDCPIR
jgi:hypothetical protein